MTTEEIRAELERLALAAKTAPARTVLVNPDVLLDLLSEREAIAKYVEEEDGILADLIRAGDHLKK